MADEKPLVAQFITLKAAVDAVSLHVARMQDREYLVVPVVALVEGVLYGQNSDGPELALAEVFGAQVQGWNGRPVVMNHPQLADGTFVSANSPSIQDIWAFGQIFNAKVENKRLKVEAWIDVERASELGGDFEETLTRLQSNELVEVSVGVFVLLEDSEGIYNGKPYSQVWVDIVPDHLALLSSGVLGACSGVDGCGAPRVNTATTTEEEMNRAHPIPGGARPSTAPVKPIQAPNSAVYARFREPPQTSARPHEARSTVCDCGGGDSCGCGPKPAAHASIAVPPPPLSDNMTAILPNGHNHPQMHVNRAAGKQVFIMDAAELAKRVSAVLSVNALPRDRFDSDVYRAISRAVKKKYPGSYCMGYTVDYVVFEQYLAEGYGYAFFKVGINVDENLSVEFVGEPVEVNLITQVIEVQTNTGEGDMTVASGGAPATDESNAGDAGTTPDPQTTDNTAAPAVNAAAAPGPKDKPVTVADYISAAPPEIRDVLQQSITVHAQQKAAVVDRLLATNRCKFSKDELNGMPLQQLQNLAALADIPAERPVADYSGRGVPRAHAVSDENQVPEPPQVFEIKKSA